MAKYARYSGLVFQMIAIVLIILWGGIELDKYLENDFPIFAILGAIGGVILSIYYTIREFMRNK